MREIDSSELPIRALGEKALDELGVSVLHVRKKASGLMEVIKDSPEHKRIMGSRRKNVAKGAELSMRGPGASMLPQPKGTLANCSGGVTPWGTVLTCEENYQVWVDDLITPAGGILDSKRVRFAGDGVNLKLGYPVEWEGLGNYVVKPLDGRTYGWVGEVNPETGSLVKYTSLGRFRHENVAVRCEKGKQLALYMGDDRRGGHLWKYVSNKVVEDPGDPNNSALLEDGVLYVAKLKADHSGEWLPLRPETPLVRPQPQFCTTKQMLLPKRPDGGHVPVATRSLVGKLRTKAGRSLISPDEWIRQVEAYSGKSFSRATLADLVFANDLFLEVDVKARQQLVILMDAFACANAIGGTPTARPEDIEIHPADHSVYIAFTDSTGKKTGSPDERIFPDSKEKNSRQYGAIYRLVEKDNEPSSTSFTWGKFVSSGEVAEGGGGFAALDNMAFDSQNNLWAVCDIGTSSLNFPVRREGKSAPGQKSFRGVFGNNAMFMIPTAGPSAGQPFCFAIAPMESELTGPTFYNEDQNLLLAVQHPGERNGMRGLGRKRGRRLAKRIKLKISDIRGRIFTQDRHVPIGSNFPGKIGQAPRPAVVCIGKKKKVST